jgi:uncharacterized membrane protein
MVRSVMWWIYYGLFLGICIFIFIAVIQYGIHMLFKGQRKLTGAQILYGVAVCIMIFGLLSMAIAYLTRTICYRIKGQPDFQKTGYHPPSEKIIESRHHALHRANGEKLEKENHS